MTEILQQKNMELKLKSTFNHIFTASFPNPLRFCRRFCRICSQHRCCLKSVEDDVQSRTNLQQHNIWLFWYFDTNIPPWTNIVTLWLKKLQWSILQLWLNFDSLCKDTELQKDISVQTLMNPTIYWSHESLSTDWRRQSSHSTENSSASILNVDSQFLTNFWVKVLKVLEFSTNVRICCLSEPQVTVNTSLKGAETQTCRRFHTSSHSFHTHFLLCSDWLSACQVVKSGTFVCAGDQRFHHTSVTRFSSAV